MTSKTNVTPKTEPLFELVKEAGKGKLALPQFQRSFVWQPDDVRQLLVSVFSQYFIGSLLLLDIDPHDHPFSCRSVEGSGIDDQTLTGVSSRLLLDGQQRITSLYYAFYAPDIPLQGRSKNSTVFFLNLQKFFDGNVNDAIYYKAKNRCRNEELEIGPWQFENLMAPLKDLLNWSKWRHAYIDWLIEDPDRYRAWSSEKSSLWDEKFNSVYNYNTSVLNLARIDPNDGNHLEEICTVFEKLNSTGVSLTVFDLLTARLYPKRVYLDTLWNSAYEQSEFMLDFELNKSEFGVLILRCIAMMRKVDLKNRALVKLDAINFNRDWARAVDYINKAFARLCSVQEGGFGVFNKKWLPYTTIIPTLAALLAKRDSLDDSKKAYATQAIRWWYWGSVFTARYSGTVETITSRDYVELSRYFEDTEHYPEVFQIAYSEIVRQESGFRLLDVERASNTLYKSVMCLLALNGAGDFRSFESITLFSPDDHHIFPKGFLKSRGVEASLGLSATAMTNTIVNRTLISKDTNQSISSLAPSKYLRNESVIPQDQKQKILERHFIDAACLELLENDEYEYFLIHREATIIKHIRSLFDYLPRPPGVEAKSDQRQETQGA